MPAASQAEQVLGCARQRKTKNEVSVQYLPTADVR